MVEGHLDYTTYNREERDICAHLFRLLLEDQPNWGPLCQFLGVEAVANPRVYCEVALVRDAYMKRKSTRIETAVQARDASGEPSLATPAHQSIVVVVAWPSYMLPAAPASCITWW